MLLAVTLPTPIVAQDARQRAPFGCAKLSCEEEIVRSLAIDSVWRHAGLAKPNQPATIYLLATVHAQPFRMEGTISPAVDVVRRTSFYTLNRLDAAYEIVDSASIVSADGHTLRRGRSLLILAPVSWRGEHVAVVRMALYRDRIDYGAEYFVRLERVDGAWRIVRIELGWQN